MRHTAVPVIVHNRASALYLTQLICMPAHRKVYEIAEENGGLVKSVRPGENHCSGVRPKDSCGSRGTGI